MQQPWQQTKSPCSTGTIRASFFEMARVPFPGKSTYSFVFNCLKLGGEPSVANLKTKEEGEDDDDVDDDDEEEEDTEKKKKEEDLIRRTVTMTASTMITTGSAWPSHRKERGLLLRQFLRAMEVCPEVPAEKAAARRWKT
jgi:hypothetical protein